MEETVRNETLVIKIIQALLKEYRTPCHLFHPVHLAHLIIKRMSVILLLNVLLIPVIPMFVFHKNLESVEHFGIWQEVVFVLSIGGYQHKITSD